jgi:DNA-binding transcriptional ArsR family regulator
MTAAAHLPSLRERFARLIRERTPYGPKIALLLAQDLIELLQASAPGRAIPPADAGTRAQAMRDLRRLGFSVDELAERFKVPRAAVMHALSTREGK